MGDLVLGAPPIVLMYCSNELYIFQRKPGSHGNFDFMPSPAIRLEHNRRILKGVPKDFDSIWFDHLGFLGFGLEVH